MPSECKQQRYVVAKSVTAALDFAAVMAQSARLLKGSSDYAGFASQAETAAKRAYEWAKANPNAFYNQFKLSQDFKPAVNTGTYGDMNARDERFWAATELYKLTADGSYLEDAKAVKPARFNAPTWGNVAGLGAWAWIAQEGSELHSEMLAQLKDYCEALVANVGTSSFQAPFGDKKSDFGWGCLAEGGCANGVALMFADRYLERGKYMRYALENMDYILGRNATGYCFVTGFGAKSPMHPHHRLSSADGIEEPFPGMLVGGPNPCQQDKRDGNLVYPSNFPDESYIDVEGSYASNEIAINWNASLVALVCWIDALKGK
jgi:endoglucanase